MAARMQLEATEALDLRRESPATLEMYGCEPDKPSFARACLLARRMIERYPKFQFAGTVADIECDKAAGHRQGGADYTWYADNVPAGIDPKAINAQWVFKNKWHALKEV